VLAGWPRRGMGEDGFDARSVAIRAACRRTRAHSSPSASALRWSTNACLPVRRCCRVEGFADVGAASGSSKPLTSCRRWIVRAWMPRGRTRPRRPRARSRRRPRGPLPGDPRESTIFTVSRFHERPLRNSAYRSSRRGPRQRAPRPCGTVISAPRPKAAPLRSCSLAIRAVRSNRSRLLPGIAASTHPRHGPQALSSAQAATRPSCRPRGHLGSSALRVPQFRTRSGTRLGRPR